MGITAKNKSVAIVSLKYSPGHVAHLKAYYMLFRDIGAQPTLFVDEGYRGSDFGCEPTYISHKTLDTILQIQPMLVLVYNGALENIALARKCKNFNIRMYYVLHEPMVSLSDILMEGKNWPRELSARLVNCIICKLSYCVILASQNAINSYKTYMMRINQNTKYFPLILCDEYNLETSIERKYISYIGGFAPAHNAPLFLKFVEYAQQNKLPFSFLIATRTNIENVLQSDVLKRAIEEKKLTVVQGRILSTEEINEYYRESICVWNAYKRSTQSSVLPNALMQGAPVIGNDIGVTKEIFENNIAGYYISSNPSYEEIQRACERIDDNLSGLSTLARETFLSKFYYKSYIQLAHEVFEL